MYGCITFCAKGLLTMNGILAVFNAINDFFKTPTLPSMIVRLMLAITLGGLIGIERGRKRRPAGLRTHMLVCLGAALTMIISQYLVTIGQTTDVSRFGAQVINGIGFLGAGSIIVTGKLEVKGLTTAAGLWASACMGLAVGSGFVFAAVIAGILIGITTALLSKLEVRIMSNSRNMNVYIEYEDSATIGDVIEKLKALNIKIFDVELSRNINASEGLHSAVFDIKLPRKLAHSAVMTSVADVDTVKSVEEL